MRWNRGLAEFEELAAQHVYNNPNFTLFDARQHRAMLHNLIAEGDFLFLRFALLQSPGDTESYTSFLDQQNQVTQNRLTDTDLALTERPEGGSVGDVPV